MSLFTQCGSQGNSDDSLQSRCREFKETLSKKVERALLQISLSNQSLTLESAKKELVDEYRKYLSDYGLTGCDWYRQLVCYLSQRPLLEDDKTAVIKQNAAILQIMRDYLKDELNEYALEEMSNSILTLQDLSASLRTFQRTGSHSLLSLLGDIKRMVSDFLKTCLLKLSLRRQVSFSRQKVLSDCQGVGRLIIASQQRLFPPVEKTKSSFSPNWKWTKIA